MNIPRRIVVGIDGSPESLAALEWAVYEAECTCGEIDAVLVYDSGLAWIDVGSEYQAAIVEHSAARAKQELLRTISASSSEGHDRITIHPLVVDGVPARVLAEHARDADLLVVGTRGRGAFAPHLLGSVSQRCAELSTCPVVIVPSPRPESSGGGES